MALTPAEKEIPVDNIHSGTYTLPSAITVQGGANQQLFAQAAGNGVIVSAVIMNYNTSGVQTLITYVGRWYSNMTVEVFNPNSTAVTIPANTEIKYIYIDYGT